MIDGFKAYKYYMAVKLHFTKDNFDVFKNRGNIKGTREAFNARNDRYIFERLARKFPVDKDVIQFFVANFAYGNDAVVYSSEEAESNYLEWNRRKQSITKIFADDCNKLLMENLKCKGKTSVFELTENQYPSILKLYLGKLISVESVRIFDDLIGMVSRWKQNSSLMLIHDDEIRRIEKLQGFVKYEPSKIEKLYSDLKLELEI